MDSGAVSLIFKGIDQISGTVDKVHGKLRTLGTTVDTLDRKVGALRGGLGRLGSILTGIGVGVGYAAFGLLERSISKVVGLIPDLINKGEDWLSVVDSLRDVMGGTAQQASILAAQAQGLEVPIDAVGRAMAMLTKNIRPNETMLNNMGVATRTANGAARDTVSIFYDVQKVLAGANPDIDKAAVLSKLFGRNWADVADLLAASPATLDAWAQHAHDAGLEVSDAALQAAEDLRRTRIALGQSVSGLGTTVFNAIAPGLTALVNAISSAIETNLAQISGFITRTAGFVMGLLSGLFGLNLQLTNFAAGARAATTPAADLSKIFDQTAKGADKSTSAIQRHIDALGKELEALNRQEQLHDATRERQDIEAEISTLEAQLEDMKGRAVFTAGESSLQAELDRQAAAQAIVDQQKQIQDAKDRLAEHDHAEQVARRRQELEDERRHLQDKLKLRRGGSGGGKGSGPFPTIPGLPGDYPRNGPGDHGIPQLAGIAEGQAFAKSLLIKIDGVIHTWSPVLTILGGISKTLLDTLGPQGFVALWLLKQFGLVSPIVTMLGTLVSRGFGGGGGGIPTGMPHAPTPTVDPTGSGGPFGFLRSLFTNPIVLPNALAGNNPGNGSEPARQIAGQLTQGNFVGDLTWRISKGLADLTNSPFDAGPGKGMGELQKPLATIGAPNISTATGFNLDAVATPLRTIATAVSPGGSLFQQQYDQSGAARENADTSASQLGGIEDLGIHTKRAADRLDAGLDTSIVNKPNINVPSPVNVLNSSLDRIQTSSHNTVVNTSPLTYLRFNNGKLATTAQAAAAKPPPYCFVAGTLVSTPSGQKPIEDIAIGDEVFALDEHTLKPGIGHVTALVPHRAHTEPRVRVMLEDGRTIEVTANHRFQDYRSWNAGMWRPIGEFQPGEELFDVRMDIVRVQPARIVSITPLGNAPTDVYNFEVDGQHTYMVAGPDDELGGILVHNVKDPPMNASGLLGLASSPYNVGVMGDAGDEAIAIVRNPRPIRGGAVASGEFGDGAMPPIVVQVQVDSRLNVDGRQIAEATAEPLMKVINSRYTSTDTRYQ